jgi:hypothetical protein
MESRVTERKKFGDGKLCGRKFKSGYVKDLKASIRSGTESLVLTSPFLRSGLRLTGTVSTLVLEHEASLIIWHSDFLWLFPLRMHFAADVQAWSKICDSKYWQLVGNKCKNPAKLSLDVSN